MAEPFTEPLADILNLDTWTETRVVTCEHHACRCARAAELAAMADSTGNAALLAEAVKVHSQRVRCRTPEAQKWESGK